MSNYLNVEMRTRYKEVETIDENPIFDMMGNELSIGDKVVCGSPYREGDIFKGTIIATTKNRIILSIERTIKVNQLIKQENCRWRRMVDKVDSYRQLLKITEWNSVI